MPAPEAWPHILYAVPDPKFDEGQDLAAARVDISLVGSLFAPADEFVCAESASIWAMIILARRDSHSVLGSFQYLQGFGTLPIGWAGQARRPVRHFFMLIPTCLQDLNPVLWLLQELARYAFMQRQVTKRVVARDLEVTNSSKLLSAFSSTIK